MKRLVLTTFALTCAWASISCSLRVPNGFIGNIAFVETMMHPDRPFYYQGRKGGRDYFLFYDDGVERRMNCPAGDIKAIAPFPYTKNRSSWQTLNDKMKIR